MADNAEKELISICIIGHVDAGKSTTSGRLIFELGGVDQRTLDRLTEQAEEAGRGSFKYAWILDDCKAERDRGVTIDGALAKFETPARQVTLIDAPGHKDFIKNMISSVAQADAVVLMVDASDYDAGFAEDGSTKDHALLAFTLGVKQMIVAVNKMDSDTVAYSEAKFEEVKDVLGSYLKRIGYRKTVWVPTSGWEGDNVTETSANMPWYDGPTLVEAIDGLTVPDRDWEAPLRIPLNDIFQIEGIGTVPAGRIEAGTLRPGSRVTFAPSGITAEVRTVQMHHTDVEAAGPGMSVAFSVRGVAKKDLKAGMVAGLAGDTAPREAESFVAQLVIMNHPGTIRVGYAPVLDIHTAHVSCAITEIISTIDKRTGEVIEEGPAELKKGDAALVRFVPGKPLCVETFADVPRLGRFAMRDMRRTVGVGVIKEVEFREASGSGGKKR